MEAAMMRGLSFQGIEVSVDYDSRRLPVGHAMVVLPDGTEREVQRTEDHPTIDSAICYAVNKWRVDRWREEGAGRPL